MTRCLNCMKEYDEDYDMCPYCGYMNGSKPEKSFQLLPGTMLENRYTIGTVIGFGGFGIIYRAWDNKLNVMVAIKECYPSGLVNRSPGQTKVTLVGDQAKRKMFKTKINRFLGEAQTMARFSEYENIVHVFDYFEANNTAYFVMEYLDGCNIRKYLKAHKLSIEESVDIIIKVCSVLKYMHKENIIHRDINLNNIMICNNGSIKLIDFGTARAQSGELSKAITAELTPGYAPPEQYETNGQQGAWTDIYALCATLYQMLTGEKPEESTDRVKDDRLVSPMELNKNIPEWLNRTIMTGMAVDYQLRFQNVDELIDGLQQKKKVLYPNEKIRKQKRIRSISIVTVLAIFCLAVCSYVAYMASYQAWFVKDGTITIWMPDNSVGQTMKEVTDKYEKRYNGKKVDVTLISPLEYAQRLSQAAEEGSLPDVFVTSDLVTEYNDQLADVSDIVDDCSDKKHFLIRENRDYLIENKFVPLTFNTIVLYENTAVSQNIDAPYEFEKIMDISKNKLVTTQSHTLYDADFHLIQAAIYPLTETEGTKNALSEFTDSDKQNTPYYIGITGERRIVQDSLAGYNNIYGISNDNVMYAEFTDKLYVSKKSYESNGELIDLWIDYLLSDNGQRIMYLQNADSLPIEKNTYSRYMSTINSLSFLKDEYESFEIIK